MILKEIWLYPVKGLRGQSAPEATVEPWGLAGDRRWLVIDGAGRFVTQRTLPILATISASLSRNELILSAQDGSSMALATPRFGAKCIDVDIWSDRTTAMLADEQANAWISKALNGEYQLAFMHSPATARPVDLTFGATGDRVSFADDFPLLLISKASLDDLNTRLKRPVDLTRFRANAVVEGAPAWAEDGWQNVTLGAVTFRVVKPCSRCVVITIDQQQGRKSDDHEPLRTLASFRRNALGETIFGQYLIPDGGGRIIAGDHVRAA